ncbi:unnamed protein product [Symbiodinium sp. CCMP2592]|nr:unnamed protein product [Symbiodinium sp. CCMP2592]
MQQPFGAEFAYALGTVIAPYCEAMVQQRSTAAMASFVQNLRPEEVTQGTDDRRQQQQMLYEHADQLMQQHMQATGAMPVQASEKQKQGMGEGSKPQDGPKATNPTPPADASPSQQEQPKITVDPPPSKGHARKVARYRTEGGTLEVFLRFVPKGCEAVEPAVIEGQGSDAPVPGSAQASSFVPPPASTTTNAPPPPPPPPDSPPHMESRPKVPSPAAPPKARPQQSTPGEIVVLPKLDAEEDMKKMAARTPAKEGEGKEEKPETPASKKRRVRRRLFETPKKESPAAKSEVSNGDDSGEDGDLFAGRFRLKASSSLPAKREALNRVPSRSKNKRRRAGSSPGPNTGSKASEATKHEDFEPEDGPALDVKEEAEQAKKPAPAPPPPLQPASEVDSEVLQFLPKGLAEPDIAIIIDILISEDLLTMQDCQENLADLETSSSALLGTSGLPSCSIDSAISGDVLSMLGASGQALFSKLTIKGKRGFLGWPAKLKARSFLHQLCFPCL